MTVPPSNTLELMRLKWGPAVRLQNKRRRRLVVVCFMLATLIVGVPTWFVFPPKESPGASDAVMVIAGSDDGRHALGARMVKDGLTKHFVVSNPEGAYDEVGFAYCRGKDRPDEATATWCLHPDPETTIGEVVTMEELATKEKWATLTVVTSQVHSRRVQTMFNYCTSLSVTVVFPSEVRLYSFIREIFHELGGYIKFWLTNPCRN